MKDVVPPLTTPFCFTNTLNTPNDQNSNHYFATRHAPSEDDFSGRALILGAGASEGHLWNSKKRDSREGLALESLPNEILSLILELGYFGFGSQRKPDSAFRTSTLKISRKFHELVLHNPALWSTVWLSPGNFCEEMSALPMYLERSMDYPLDIQLNCFWHTATTDTLMDVLLPRIKRWKRLAITTADDHILKLLKHSAPFLEELEISFYSHLRRASLPPHIFEDYLPRLTYLCLRNIDLTDLNFSLHTVKTLEIRGYGIWPTHSRLKEMLGDSSSVERLILHVKPSHVMEQVFAERVNPGSGCQILLPALRDFEVYTSEWLTPNIVALVHLFAFPKIESLVVRENPGSSMDLSQTVLHYAAHTTSLKDAGLRSTYSPSASWPLHGRFPNQLIVRSAQLQLACSTMGPTTLTTLELHKVFWPAHTLLKDAFEPLKALKNLFILDFNANAAILQILRACEEDRPQPSELEKLESLISLPSLDRLMIVFHQADLPPELPADCTTVFFRMFSLPALREVHFKNLRREQWKGLNNAFARHTTEYPELSSLTLSDMTDILPTNPDDPQYVDIVDAFPCLRELALDNVPSNPFLRQLASHPSTSPNSSSVPLPHIRQISICHDPHASKPLIHRLITTRMEHSRPLMKLRLDRHFTSNVESYEWIKERVEVEVVETSSWRFGL